MKSGPLKLRQIGKKINDLHAALLELGLVVPEAEIQRGRFGPGTRTAVIEFQVACGIIPTGEVDATTASALRKISHTSVYVVSGTVSSPDSVSVGGLTVELVDKDVGPDVPLATTKTDTWGNYTVRVTISPESLRKRHKTSPDLQVRVSSGSTFLAASDVQYNASTSVTLNVVLPAKSTALASEYETLVATLSKSFSGNLGDLQETATRQDITYLANKTGWDARAVAMAALADQFSRNQPAQPASSTPSGSSPAPNKAAALTSSKRSSPTATTGSPSKGSGSSSTPATIPPAFYYALFRAGLAPNAATLYQTSAKTVTNIWTQAIAQDVIPASLSGQIDSAAQAFQGFGAGTILTTSPQVGVSTMQSMLYLRFTDPTTQQQQAQQFANLYTQNQDDMTKFWGAVQNAFGATLTQQLQLDGQLGALTLNNAPLISRLYAATTPTTPVHAASLAALPAGAAVTTAASAEGTVAAASSIQSPQDLVSLGYYQASAWLPLIQNDIPTSIPGANQTEQRTNYANMLAAQVRLTFPNAILADMVTKKAAPIHGDPDGTVGTEIAKFLNANQSQFDIGSEPVERFLARTPGVSVSTPAITQIKRLQRVYQITPDDQSFTALLAANVDSAYVISQYSPDSFVRRFGTAMTEAVARRVHTQARMVHYATLNITASYVTGKRGITFGTNGVTMLNPLSGTPATPGQTAPIVIASATLEELFGSMDFCTCDECRSVLGFAAYYVDMLMFTNCKAPQIQNPQQVLFNRRPDIPNLLLTCENTNTVICALDPILELLEYFVANDLSLQGFVGYNTDDTLTSAELLASPQNINDAAYSILQNACFPPPCPFHRPLELLRLHFQKIGVSLPDVMTALRPNDAVILGSKPYGWTDILMERLGFSRVEYQILTTSNFTLRQVYGLNLPTDLAAISPLSNFVDYSRRTGVSYDDLISILETQFINPSAPLIPRLEALNVSFAEIMGLNNGTISDADFIANLPSGLDPADYGAYPGTPSDDYQAIVDWLTDPGIYNEIMGLITLANPTVGSITVDGVFAASQNLSGTVAGFNWNYTTPNTTTGTLAQIASGIAADITAAAAAALAANSNADANYTSFAVGEVVYISPNNQSDASDSNFTITASGAGGILLTAATIDNTDLCSPENLWFRYSNPDNTRNQLQAVDFIRLLRFIRLWQKLGLTIELTDDLITAHYPTGAAYSFTGNTPAVNLTNLDSGWAIMMPRIGFVFDIMQQLGLSPNKDLTSLLACWSDIGTFGDNSLYRSMFLTPALLQEDAGAQTATVTGTVAQGDVLTTTINGAALNPPYSVTAGQTNSVVAGQIASQINATNNVNDPITGKPINALFYASQANPGDDFFTLRAAIFTVACSMSANPAVTYATAAATSPVIQNLTLTLTAGNLSPKVNDVLTTTINGVAIPYAVAANDTDLTTLAGHIIGTINSAATADPISGLPLNNILVASNTAGVVGGITLTAVGPGMPFDLECTIQNGDYQVTSSTPATQTVTLGGPCAQNDALNITINKITLQYNLGPTDTTLPALASDLVTFINQNTNVDPSTTLPVNCVVEASAVGNVLTITAVNPAATFTFSIATVVGTETFTPSALNPPQQVLTVAGSFAAGATLSTTINGVVIPQNVGGVPIPYYTVTAADVASGVPATIASNIATHIVSMINNAAALTTDPFTNLAINLPINAASAGGVITITVTGPATVFTVACSSDTSGYVAGRQLPTFAPDKYGDFLSDATQYVFGHEPTLRAAFNLTGAEFELIIEDLGFDASTGLTLANISKIYRIGWLARALRMSVTEFVLLKKFTGLDPFSTIDPSATPPAEPPVIRFIRTVQRLQAVSVKPVQALYLMWNQDISGKSAPAQSVINSLARTLRSDFSTINTQFAIQDDPDGTIANSLMVLAYGQDATDYFFGLLNNTITFSVPYGNPQPTLPQALVGASNGRLSYDDFRKQLTFAGFLDSGTLSNLLTNAGPIPPLLLNALTALANVSQQAVQPFFNQYQNPAPGLESAYTNYATSTAPLAERRNALLAQILPALKTARKIEQAQADASAAAGADPSCALALLDNINAFHAVSHASCPAVDDLTAIETGGLAVQFFYNNIPSPTPDLSLWAEDLTYAPVVMGASQNATIYGTVQVNDVLAVTINGVPVPYTVGSTDVPTEALAFAKKINLTTTPDPVSGLPLNDVVVATSSGNCLTIDALNPAASFALAASLASGTYTASGSSGATLTAALSGAINPGDVLTTTINGTPVTYTVAAGDTLTSIATNIVLAINNTATPDSVTGLPLNCVVLAVLAAGVVTIHAVIAGSTFTLGCALQPALAGACKSAGPFPAWQTLTIGGNATTNDQLTLTINNVPVTYPVANGDTPPSIAAGLVKQINGTITPAQVLPLNRVVFASSQGPVLTITAIDPATSLVITPPNWAGLSEIPTLGTLNPTSQTVTITGTFPVASTVTAVIDNVSVTYPVAQGDDATAIANHIAALINSNLTVDTTANLPLNQVVKAFPAAGVVTISVINPRTAFTLSCSSAEGSLTVGGPSQAITVTGSAAGGAHGGGGHPVNIVINGVLVTCYVGNGDSDPIIAGLIVSAINSTQSIDSVSGLPLNQLVFAQAVANVVTIYALPVDANFTLSCSAPAGSETYTTGAAPNDAQVLTVGGTFAQGNLLTVAINNIPIQYTAVANDTAAANVPATIAADLVLQINQTVSPDPVSGRPFNQVFLASSNGPVILLRAAGATFELSCAVQTGTTETFAAAGQLPIPAGGGPIAGVWSGFLNAAKDDDYDFTITTDPNATITLEIDGTEVELAQTGSVWTNSTAISLAANSLSEITLTATGLSSTLSVSWGSASQATEIVSDSYLYSATLMDRLETTYVRFLKMVSLATALKLTADEIVWLATPGVSACTGTFPVGANTFTLDSMAGIAVGINLVLDTGNAQETVTVTSVTATTFAATTKLAHDGSTTPFLISLAQWPDLLTVDSDPDPVTAAALRDVLLPLLDYARIKAALSPQDERLLNALQDPSALLPNNTDALLSLTGWNSDSLNALLLHFFQTTSRVRLSVIEDFARVYDAFTVVDDFGISAAILIAATTNDPSPQTVSTLQSALRALYAKADWLTVIQPISDAMRHKQRDALVAYILQNLGDNPATSDITTADQLFEFFLVDVMVEPIIQTSRLRQAGSSVQLFIDRCLRNLEPLVAPTDLNAADWEWMKRYRVWEANREIFLWPENWLYPELRTDQSQFFKDTMSELLQSDVTDDAAATAYLNYLNKLEEVAKLEPCAMYYQADPSGPNGPDDLVHMVGRTSGSHRKYYYRCMQYGDWTPWEEIKLSIEDNPIAIFVWNGRLLLFWLNIHQKTPTDGSNQKSTDQTNLGSNPTYGTVKNNALKDASNNTKVTVSATLCWSEYFDGKWQNSKSSDVSNATTIGSFPLTQPFDRTQYQLQVAPYAGNAFTDPPGTSDRLTVTITPAGSGFDSNEQATSLPGFLLFNTHSSPLPLDTTPLAPSIWPSPLPWRLFCAGSAGNPILQASPSSSPITFSIQYYELLGSGPGTLIANTLQWSPNLIATIFGLEIVAPQPMSDYNQTWMAPFFYEDSKNAFYVTTTMHSAWNLLGPGYGVYGTVQTANTGGFTIPLSTDNYTNDGNIMVSLGGNFTVNFGTQAIGPTGSVETQVQFE